LGKGCPKDHHQCGVFLSESEACVNELYLGDTYEKLNKTWHEEDAPWKAARIEKIIRKNNLKFNSICEVGCGTGEILFGLSHAFPQVSIDGYEIAPHAYSRAVAKGNPHVSFHLRDILQEQDVSFDIVVIADVIEHVDDCIGFVKGLRRLGRYKIFHIPLDLSAQSVFRGWPIMNLRANVGHLHYFFKDSALAMLAECGYSIVDWTYTASRLELPGQALSSRLMRLPRKLCYSISPDFTARVLGGFSLLVVAE
jgi:SAM-dependent methyltransferase